ncbi:MAG: 16S rRNA (guanine(966)-N(2))-methyltransferase RsmD [Gammaproteobacteria bacterium]|nr:16S rRNA (guanine(966)-N(2))-methyltransferase RsmD [Gammaproteobacteria bacterium]
MKSPTRPAKQKSHHSLRIIAGKWRGRRLDFPVLAGVRPTPERVRETLFNWLAPVIHGSRCLDLYAGSGALGLEAASRGAAKSVLVDRAAPIIAALGQHCEHLQAENIELIQSDAFAFLKNNKDLFDIVFLDPPFADNLMEQSLALLLETDCLRPDARVYIEMKKGDRPVLPAGWEFLRSKQAGQVEYHLLVRNTKS